MSSSETVRFGRVCVIGLGYIGLPTAAILASRGLTVVGVDINADIVDTVNAGKVHIQEPDLDIVVRSVVLSGNLRASSRPEKADAFIVAVPTPFCDGYKPDLSHIKAAAAMLGPVLEKSNLVVLESTVPVGSTEKFSGWLSEIRPDLAFGSKNGRGTDVYMAHCPERVLPGRVLIELVSNDRVIGGLTPESTVAATTLYKTFVQGNCVPTDTRTAELVKLTENAFRDVNIAFANEMSLVCDSLGVNVWDLIALANRHPRVNILQPGPGVGGHCIAVDPWFIVDGVPEHTQLIRAARHVNDSKPEFVADKIRTAIGRSKAPVVACLGLAFKANVDDLRESPSIEIARSVAADPDIRVLAVEPHVARLPARLASYSNIRLVETEQALRDASVIALLVDHDAFRRIDRRHLADKTIIDTRGLWR